MTGAETGMLKVITGALCRGTLISGNEAGVGEKASSAQRFAPGFKGRLSAGCEVGWVVEVNGDGYQKACEEGEVLAVALEPGRGR